ncbi:MAG: hypothetical protein B7733_09780 [Myxococcales bacterium FL481]|nr:MAG: hypothetical protein B7733_09780 [Myxococcales bacterium FL481]
MVTIAASQPEVTAGAQTRRALSRSVRQLASVAVDQPEGSAAAGALAVAVIQEGGPSFVRPALRAALRAEGTFVERETSPHLLRAEVVGRPPQLAVSLRLWRRGWDLVTPEPTWIYTAPWCVVAAAVIGAVLASVTRAIAVGVWVAALLAQLASMAMPWPAGGLGRPTWGAWTRQGPVVSCWVDALQGWVVAYVLATGTVFAALAWFYDRQVGRPDGSRGLASSVTRASVISIGGLTWIEAAGRFGVLALDTTWSGRLALLLLVLVWADAVRAVAAKDKQRGP